MKGEKFNLQCKSNPKLQPAQTHHHIFVSLRKKILKKYFKFFENYR